MNRIKIRKFYIINLISQVIIKSYSWLFIIWHNINIICKHKLSLLIFCTPLGNIKRINNENPSPCSTFESNLLIWLFHYFEQSNGNDYLTSKFSPNPNSFANRITQQTNALVAHILKLKYFRIGCLYCKNGTSTFIFIEKPVFIDKFD